MVFMRHRRGSFDLFLQSTFSDTSRSPPRITLEAILSQSSLLPSSCCENAPPLRHWHACILFVK